MSFDEPITKEEVDSLKATRSLNEWYSQVNEIKLRRDGYLPPDWEEKVIKSGVWSRLHARWMIVDDAVEAAAAAVWTIAAAFCLFSGDVVGIVTILTLSQALDHALAIEVRRRRERKNTPDDVWDPVSGTFITPEPRRPALKIVK